MAESPLSRFDLRLIGVSLGALVVTAMLFALPILFASTQPHRTVSEQSSVQ